MWRRRQHHHPWEAAGGGKRWQSRNRFLKNSFPQEQQWDWDPKSYTANQKCSMPSWQMQGRSLQPKVRSKLSFRFQQQLGRAGRNLWRFGKVQAKKVGMDVELAAAEPQTVADRKSLTEGRDPEEGITLGGEQGTAAQGVKCTASEQCNKSPPTIAFCKARKFEFGYGSFTFFPKWQSV